MVLGLKESNIQHISDERQAEAEWNTDMMNVESVQMFQPTKQTSADHRVDKVLIGGIDGALRLICGFLCLFALLTHASSLNLVIFQSTPVSSFQNEPIKQQRCWHTGRDMRGRINYVPENVCKQERSSAQLKEKAEAEPWAWWWMRVVQIYYWTYLHSTPPPSYWGLQQSISQLGRIWWQLRSNWRKTSSVFSQL